MTLGDWIEDTTERVRRDGLGGVYESAYQLYLGGIRRVGEFYDYGTPIYERDWDVLVVLDACRADMMQAIADDYDLDCSEIYSNASYSRGWMNRNFGPEYDAEKRRTAYVTGNPFSADTVDGDDFADFREVWRYAWDDDLGTIHARPITDHAIDAWRNGDAERMVIHYMQPHVPFVPAPELDDGFDDAHVFGDTEETDIWQQVRRGEADETAARQAYYDNLRYVLDDVTEVLLQSIDAETVVLTADHANALGEWGVWGHPPDVPLPSIRRVPWCVTSGTDTGSYDPEPVSETETDADVDERLRNLGYV